MGVGYHVRIWWLVAVLALLLAACFAAGENSGFSSGDEARKIATGTQRRLLGVHLNDYGEPSANKGHDPRGKGRQPPKKKRSKKRNM
ncbi:hypothetical protein CTI12_AA492630 [Artemisia annua]|uniref:Uncharacterized protein n=1 Tax=Artemisia annua TaxID=35608 RepID=A0A2U1LH07_ARTAN|nr:hypothetical protein CTI12_AA492630 [Artemisia annua]